MERSTLIMASLFCYTCLAAELRPVFHEIQPNPGLVFFKDKNIQLVADEWTITTSIKISQLQDIVRGIKMQLHNLDTEIRSIPSIKLFFIGHLLLLKNKIKHLEAKQEEILILATSYEIRSRATKEINEIHLLSRYLKNKEQIKNSLIQMRSYDHEAIPGKQNNTYFIENEIYLSNKEISKELAILVKEFTLISKANNSSPSLIEDSYTRLQSCIVSLENSIYKTIKSHDIIIKVLQQNQMFLPIRIMEYVLNSIEKISKLRFPISLDSLNFQLFNKISETIIIFDENEILIQSIAPLVSKTIFTLYKLIPLPVFQISKNYKDVSAVIKPSAEFIAFASVGENYLLLNNSHLDRCVKLHTKFICKNNVVTQTRKSCEFNLFNDPTYDNLANCPIEFNIEKRYFLKKTPNPLVWLFSSDNNETLEAICGHDEYEFSMYKPAIVELPPRCTLIIHGQKFRGAYDLFDFDQIYIPQLQLIVFNVDELLLTTEKTLHFVNVTSETSNKKDNSQVLQYMWQNFKLRIIIISLSILVVLFGIILAFIVICVGIKKLIKKTKNNNKKNETKKSDSCEYVPMRPLTNDFLSKYKNPTLPRTTKFSSNLCDLPLATDEFPNPSLSKYSLSKSTSLISPASSTSETPV